MIHTNNYFNFPILKFSWSSGLQWFGLHCGGCRCAERLGFESPAGTDVWDVKKKPPPSHISVLIHTHKFVPSWVRGLGRAFGVQNTQKCRLSPNQQNEQKKTQKTYKRCERAEEGGGRIKKNNNKEKTPRGKKV